VGHRGGNGIVTSARLILAALIVLGGARLSAGQAVEGLPARVTLDQVLQLLEERSPRTAAERATIDVVAADRITANTLPNPSLSYGGLRLVSGVSTGAVTQHQLVMEQPLLLFGQRQTRRDAADLNVSAEEARVAASLAARRLDVRQAFATLLARQEQMRILEDSRTELRRIEGVVRGRAEEGDRSRYDVLRIETEGRMLDIEVMNAATDVDDAAGRLAALLGFPGWRPGADGVLDAGNVPTELDALWDIAQRRRPALVAIQRRQTAAQGGVLLAQRQRLPIPAVSGGALFTREGTGTSAFFGVSLPLPMFDRNRGAIARASAEVEAETRALNAQVAEARAEIERTRATFLGRRETLSTVDRDIVQRVPGLRRMAEDAYREGRGDILELLDASRSLKNIQLLRVKQLEMTKLAEEEVIAAAGLDAPPVP
jgi:cobalt-zinc-cadmium efflux system outer membrane protein